MKKITLTLTFIFIICLLSGCQVNTDSCQIAATTLPVYEFTSTLCEGTNLQVCQIVTQNVSCLHDYTLQSSQMRLLETADTIVISGGGLEDFLEDVLPTSKTIVDASSNIGLFCADDHHKHSDHHSHDKDPHIWLSPKNAKAMAANICANLAAEYPQYEQYFSSNLEALIAKLDALQSYGEETLHQLSCRELITFHDGFAYLAEAFDLTILKAVEEESGSEASAAELKNLILLIQEHKLPALFTETNGSTSAAKIISAETGVSLYSLDMAMSEAGYFEAMYHNIDIIKEALK